MSEHDIIDYAHECGLAAAENLLLLIGPDGFHGDYNMFCRLEAELNTGWPLEAEPVLDGGAMHCAW